MNDLAWLDRATEAIDRIATIGEAKELADKAAALRIYAAKQKWSQRERHRVAEIEVRAGVRMGELLATTPLHKGASEPKETRFQIGTALADIGVTKKESHVAQRAASVDRGKVDLYIRRCAETETMPRLSAVAKIAKRDEVAERVNKNTDTTGVCESVETLSETGAQFGCVYADPPWSYSNQATRASTDNHYHTMTVDEICALPVSKVAATQSHLHLWTTNAFLFDAKRVMDAWGFQYKSVFVWCKPQMGIGNYWRVSHEFLLLGVRGSTTFPAGQKNLRSWAELSRGRHSAKPEQVRKWIEKASPGPRLELFARHQHNGWTVIGNQIERSLYEVQP